MLAIKHNRLTPLSIAFVLIVFGAPLKTLGQSSWKPAKMRLTTPWTGEVSPETVHQKYPRPQMVREEWKNLNGLWQFEAAQAGEKLPVSRDLDSQILVPFAWQSALSGIKRQIDSHRAWYKRTFTIPKGWRKDENRILLHFEASDWRTRIYVNGRLAAVHKGGYDPFTIDITAELTEDGPQQLIVNIWDPGNSKPIPVGKQRNNRFNHPYGIGYTPSSGLWQTVWIEPVSQNYIQNIHIVPEIDRNDVLVTVYPKYNGEAQNVKLIIRNNEKIVAQEKGPLGQPIRIQLPHEKLWWPSRPFLYDLKVIFTQKGKQMDIVDSYFGMRKISIGKVNGDQRILLNNKFIFEMGVLYQGYWPGGIYTAPTDSALRWDIMEMKQWGFNMVRMHVKVASRRWYYWADKLGILVWQDMPSAFGMRSEQERTQFELELTRMVKKHWNHPSIVMWVPFNEHWGLYDAARISHNIKAIDPSRLVDANSGVNSGRPREKDYEVGDIKDIHHYLAPAAPLKSSSRASVLGEYGALGYVVKGHVWEPNAKFKHNHFKNGKQATNRYVKYIHRIRKLKKRQALSAAVYTQWTDVEQEINGIYTYDRKVAKLDKQRVRKANRSLWEADIPNNFDDK